MASSNPFPVGSRGWGMLDQQNHAAGGANGSIMVGMFVCLCLTSKNPSEREIFVPARTDLGVKLLNTHISEMDTNLYPSIPKWSLTCIQEVANLPGYYETGRTQQYTLLIVITLAMSSAP